MAFSWYANNTTGEYEDNLKTPEKIKAFAKGLNREQRYNRYLLRSLLLKEGFAPFNGEWWHFSYGDKEWASFYGRKKSLYSSVIID